FEDVEWSVANGDPINKPLGQDWVGDPEALEKYGIPMPDGTKAHRFGFFEDSQEKDPTNLLHTTWKKLQEVKEPIVSYEMTVQTFADILGYEHEQVSVGDTASALDDSLGAILETRVVVYRYDLSDHQMASI